MALCCFYLGNAVPFDNAAGFESGDPVSLGEIVLNGLFVHDGNFICRMNARPQWCFVGNARVGDRSATTMFVLQKPTPEGPVTS